MLFLRGHDVSTTYAVKIYKQYGDQAIEIVSKNPYQLATDIYGIGFITADTIARKLGIAPDSDFRYQAGLLYVLSQAGEEGHCFLPVKKLVEHSTKRLALPDAPVDPARIEVLIDEMAKEQHLIVEQGYGDLADQQICYAPAFYHTEVALARRLASFASAPVEVDLERVGIWIDRFTEKRGITLSAEQRRAVELAASSRLLVLTGGPGCGKTFTIRTIVALWRAMRKSILLAAPTGRAAQRLAELTHVEAKTIHRMLAFDPGTMKFRHDEDNPLEAQAFVVDETSMLDLFLAHSLFKAIPTDAQILLVGDIDQLPSVGPGMVLRDLIASEQIPVVRLTEVFRQAATSHIITNAHRINTGQMPRLAPLARAEESDCLWMDAAEPADGVEAIRRLVTDILPRRGINPVKDVQVLCPATRGDIGTRQLNVMLQQALNPAKPGKWNCRAAGVSCASEIASSSRSMTTREKSLMEILVPLRTLTWKNRKWWSSSPEREVSYDYADLGELALAWAVTVHKSQGSEFSTILFPLFLQHYVLLSRNLLYTGLTRAKQLAVLIGPPKAIGLTVKRVMDRQRYTGLSDRLKSYASAPSQRASVTKRL